MRIQSQAHQYPAPHTAATEGDKPSEHFDSGERTLDAEGRTFTLAWVAPNEVEVQHDNLVVGYIDPDMDWTSGDVTGWDYIVHLFEADAHTFADNI